MLCSQLGDLELHNELLISASLSDNKCFGGSITIGSLVTFTLEAQGLSR